MQDFENSIEARPLPAPFADDHVAETLLPRILMAGKQQAGAKPVVC
jgi:hypothetical protein